MITVDNPYILITLGVILILLHFIKIPKFWSRQIPNGVKVEGIIFDLSTQANPDFDSHSNSTYPIVRFVTIDGTWITETSRTSIFPDTYKPGDKVAIVYDPKNPSNFTFDSDKPFQFPVAIFYIGCLIVVIGVLFLLGVIPKEVQF